MKKVIFIFVVLGFLISLALIMIPRGMQIIVPAECADCLCVNAPECVPIEAEVRGFPYYAFHGKVTNEYAQKEYLTKFALMPAGLIKDVIIGMLASFLLAAPFALRISRENSRH
jgi:hypothetical protein